MADVTIPENDQTLYPKNVYPLVPLHDAILPYVWEGVTWAVPNLGDNVETESSVIAELFENTNRQLAIMSNQRDNFVQNPPTIYCVKCHHNLYVRLNRFIDARTKQDNEERLDLSHVSPDRRVFRVYPVRYFDVRNRYTRRWIELYLYGLSNLVQLASANTWVNDWGVLDAKEMRKPFFESYRLMAVELFNVDLEKAKDPKFLLTQADFDAYNVSETIPVLEQFDHPYQNFFSEDRLRRIMTPSVPIGQGVETLGGDEKSPAEKQEQAQSPIIQ